MIILLKPHHYTYNNKNKWFGIKSDFSADIDVIRAQDVRFLFFKSILSASL